MELTRDYLTLPRRLIIELRDNPLALALYCWIARLYLIAQAPVPLSRSDVRMYDPSTKEGAIKRAFDRRIDGGWLIESEGYKSSYVPVWGKRRGAGAPYPWKIGADHLGCPRHIETIRIDRAILDVYMGRFRPHMRNPLTESYFSKPLIRLSDVGAYLLIAAGLPVDDTKMLRQWGLVCEGAIQAIPDDAIVVALASQRASIEGFKLTEEGWRKLGWGATRTNQQRQEPQQKTEAAPLIFVPKELIGALIPNLIGESIGCSASADEGFSPSESAENALPAMAQTITGTHGDSQESRESPPNPPTHTQHGGGVASPKQQRTNQRIELPDTESARFLFSLGVNDPNSIAELATMPSEQVGGAIAYAKSEDLGPGWVVTALRRHRDEGWPIPRPRRRGNSEMPIDIEQYIGGAYGDLFMRGSDLSGLDDSDRELVQQNGQTRAQGTEPNLVQPGASATAQGDDQAVELEPADGQYEEMVLGQAGHTTLVRLWNRVLNTMQVQMSRHEFNTWVRRTSLLSIANGVATIGTPSAFFKEGFENRYTGAVRGLISDLYAPVSQVRVVITGASDQLPYGLPSSTA